MAASGNVVQAIATRAISPIPDCAATGAARSTRTEQNLNQGILP